MDYFVLVAVLDTFFYSVSLHKKTLELTAVVVLANLFKHNTLITSLRVIYKYKNVSFCSYKLYREGFVNTTVLAYAQFAALGSISFGSRLRLVSFFYSLSLHKKTLELTEKYFRVKILLRTLLYFISQAHSQSE